MVYSNDVSGFSFYYRYMDDAFIVCETNMYGSKIRSRFNTVHPAMKFTCGEGSQNKIAFLNVLSRQTDGSIERDLFRKSAWTGQYTHFLSLVPLQYKRNLVKTLSYGIKAIFLEDTVGEELATLPNTLIENDYPDKFMKKQMIAKMVRKDVPTASRKPLYIRYNLEVTCSARYYFRNYADNFRRLLMLVNYKFCFPQA
ncbi:unnamed protein product [Heterobilharzia americana]|nr:unnamed protein product [Heterobilharzia americana]